MTACDADSSETWVCQISRNGNYHGYIVWNPHGTRDFNVPGNWKVVYQRDIVGNSRPMSFSGFQSGPARFCWKQKPALDQRRHHERVAQRLARSGLTRSL